MAYPSGNQHPPPALNGSAYGAGLADLRVASFVEATMNTLIILLIAFAIAAVLRGLLRALEGRYLTPIAQVGLINLVVVLLLVLLRLTG